MQGAVGVLYPYNYKVTRESSSEKNCKSVQIWQNYGHESVVPLFWPTLYTKHRGRLSFARYVAVRVSNVKSHRESQNKNREN